MFNVIPNADEEYEMDAAICGFLRAMNINARSENGFLRVDNEGDCKRAIHYLEMLKSWISSSEVVTDDWSDRWK